MNPESLATVVKELKTEAEAVQVVKVDKEWDSSRKKQLEFLAYFS